jgi:hypothetical protein
MKKYAYAVILGFLIAGLWSCESSTPAPSTTQLLQGKWAEKSTTIKVENIKGLPLPLQLLLGNALTIDTLKPIKEISFIDGQKATVVTSAGGANAPTQTATVNWTLTESGSTKTLNFSGLTNNNLPIPQSTSSDIKKLTTTEMTLESKQKITGLEFPVPQFGNLKVDADVTTTINFTKK